METDQQYLLVATKSPWDSRDEVDRFVSLALQFAEDGACVDIYFVQDAVLMARKTVDADVVDMVNQLAEYPNIRLWADDFSMQQRALDAQELFEAIQLGNMVKFVELLTADNCKPIWHS